MMSRIKPRTSPAPIGILIAVYGTLREGEGNHYILADLVDKNHARLIQGNVCIHDFAMLDIGGLPAAYSVPNPDGTKEIQADVYAITSPGLSALDLLEGHPDFYRRRLTAVELEVEEGTHDLTSVFIYTGPRARAAQGCTIPAGKWLYKADAYGAKVGNWHSRDESECVEMVWTDSGILSCESEDIDFDERFEDE